MRTFNITAKDAKFIVNEKNRTVVCIIEHTSDLFCNFVNENFKLTTYSGIWDTWLQLNNLLQMPNKFVGLARCGEDDTWNEKIGRAIAFSRAKDNLLNSFFKRANTFVKYWDNSLQEAVDTLNTIADKFENNTERRHNYIKELIDESCQPEA